MRYPVDTRICVIGAGPGGLSMAHYLQAAGYTNITILERRERVGGQCASPMVDGRSYELGAIEIAPDYVHVLPLVAKHRLELITAPEVFLLDRVDGKRYPSTYQLHGLGFLQRLGLVWEAFRYYLELGRASDQLERPGYRHVSADLARPFQEWAAGHGLGRMWRFLTLPVTAYGYGHLDEIPAAYILKYIDKSIFKTMMKDALLGLFGKTGAWPKRFVAGWQSMMEAVATDITSVEGSRILEGVTVNSVRRDGAGSDPVTVEYEVEGAREAEGFDHLVLSSLLTEDALGFVDLTQDERNLLGRVSYRSYYTTLAEIPGLERGVYMASVENGVVGDIPDRLPLSMIKWWEDSDWIVLYTPSDTPMSIEDVEAGVRGTAAKWGWEVESIRGTWSWQYFPRVGPDDIEDGFYDHFDAIQGQNATYYSGGLLNFEMVERCFAWSEGLVKRFFA